MPFIKDPDATLDYCVDWTSFLDGSAIITSSWTADAGLTVDDEVNDGLKATAYISGGESGRQYSVVNQITFVVDGVTLTDERTIKIRVQQQ
jgi:hypothetical protein